MSSSNDNLNDANALRRGGNASKFGSAKPSFGGASMSNLTPKEKAPEEEKYDFEPNTKYDYDLSQYDPEVKIPMANSKKTVIVISVVIAVLFAFFFGWLASGVFADRANVNRRINIAEQAKKAWAPKVENFNTFATLFKNRYNALSAKSLDYDKQFHEEVIANYASEKYNFMLDFSSDLPGEVFLLAQNQSKNPLSDLRTFSSSTMLLVNIISNHLAETNADREELDFLTDRRKEGEEGKAAGDVMAVKINPTLIQNMATMGTNRDFAFRIDSLYRVITPILDDNKASAIWSEMKSSMSQNEIKELTAPDKAGGVAIDLPRFMIYEIQARGKKSEYVFAKDILLADRSILLGTSSNALQRYRNRMKTIYALLSEVEKSTKGLVEKTDYQAKEDTL